MEVGHWTACVQNSFMGQAVGRGLTCLEFHMGPTAKGACSPMRGGDNETVSPSVSLDSYLGK